MPGGISRAAVGVGPGGGEQTSSPVARVEVAGVTVLLSIWAVTGVVAGVGGGHGVDEDGAIEPASSRESRNSRAPCVPGLALIGIATVYWWPPR